MADCAQAVKPRYQIYFVPPFIGTGRAGGFRFGMQMTRNPQQTSGFLFGLDEYSDAFLHLFDDALEALSLGAARQPRVRPHELP